MSQFQQRQTPQHHEGVGEQFAVIGRGGPTISFGHRGYKGVMCVDGIPQRPVRVLEEASSNGLTKYTAVIWQDPHSGIFRTSCNCPAWTIMRGATRGCKHTAKLEAGQVGEGYEELAVRPTQELAPKTAEIVENYGRMLRDIAI